MSKFSRYKIVVIFISSLFLLFPFLHFLGYQKTSECYSKLQNENLEQLGKYVICCEGKIYEGRSFRKGEMVEIFINLAKITNLPSYYLCIDTNLLRPETNEPIGKECDPTLHWINEQGLVEFKGVVPNEDSLFVHIFAINKENLGRLQVVKELKLYLTILELRGEII